MPIFYVAALAFCLFLCVGTGRAQESGNNFFAERKFLFEVKQIDEFIERFNDDEGSFLREHIKQYYPDVKIDRTSLLRTLFDNDNKKLPAQLKKEFIDNVISAPLYLGFGDNDWYADVTCSFTYKNRSITAKLRLQVVADSSMGSEWKIGNISCAAIPAYANPLPATPSTDRFISPMSHTTNFSGLDRVFLDKAHMKDYLTPKCLQEAQAQAFLHAWRNNEIRFTSVQSIRYHFAQIPGWHFMVELCAKQKSINTGWLITSLEKTNNTVVAKEN